MSNNTCVAVNIIKRARKYSNAACLIAKELEYVLHHPDLHNLDKLIWSKVAIASVDDPSLECTLDVRALASLYKTYVADVFKALLRLKRYGFLLIGFNVHVTRFENIQSLIENEWDHQPLGVFNMPESLLSEDVRSVHCVLVLPNSGLIALMEKKKRETELMTN